MLTLTIREKKLALIYYSLVERRDVLCFEEFLCSRSQYQRTCRGHDIVDRGNAPPVCRADLDLVCFCDMLSFLLNSKTQDCGAVEETIRRQRWATFSLSERYEDRAPLILPFLGFFRRDDIRILLSLDLRRRFFRRGSSRTSCFHPEAWRRCIQ